MIEVTYFDSSGKEDISTTEVPIVNNPRAAYEPKLLTSLPNPALPPVTITILDDKSGMSETANVLFGGKFSDTKAHIGGLVIEYVF
jgi:hypothetical protein